MNRGEIIKILEQSGAMKNGHFLLASGKHSEKYVQCAKLFERPEYAEKLVAELISELDTEQIDTVAGPAVGAVIMAYEVARQLGKRVIFTERKTGVMSLRRGFEIVPGERILVVEDVVT
ncbi:orotate phosphoribosyltransferase, partial [Candidatus Calescamantes bacterium]|nr:orotate phosphoribosyltransferase [Candidatus Calescamantes bacterium]